MEYIASMINKINKSLQSISHKNINCLLLNRLSIHLMEIKMINCNLVKCLFSLIKELSEFLVTFYLR